MITSEKSREMQRFFVNFTTDEIPKWKTNSRNFVQARERENSTPGNRLEEIFFDK
jgi:hypothetical protein